MMNRREFLKVTGAILANLLLKYCGLRPTAINDIGGNNSTETPFNVIPTITPEDLYVAQELLNFGKRLDILTFNEVKLLDVLPQFQTASNILNSRTDPKTYFPFARRLEIAYLDNVGPIAGLFIESSFNKPINTYVVVKTPEKTRFFFPLLKNNIGVSLGVYKEPGETNNLDLLSASVSAMQLSDYSDISKLYIEHFLVNKGYDVDIFDSAGLPTNKIEMYISLATALSVIEAYDNFEKYGEYSSGFSKLFTLFTIIRHSSVLSHNWYKAGFLEDSDSVFWKIGQITERLKSDGFLEDDPYTGLRRWKESQPPEIDENLIRLSEEIFNIRIDPYFPNEDDLKRFNEQNAESLASAHYL